MSNTNSVKIAVVGTGYVGLVSGTCFASVGHDVVCIDNDASKIEGLQRAEVELPIYERGLDNLVKTSVDGSLLSFTTDLKKAVAESDVVFIAVGTPERKDNGQADLQYVHQVAKEIGEAMNGYTVVVNKSTVPIGTAEEVTAIINSVNPNAEFTVVSNPEFLREGVAINDFLHGDRVVVGVEDKRAQELMRQIYLPLSNNGMPVLSTAVKAAEMIKYASNTFLSIKLGFINEMADLCEKLGVDVKEVAKGMGMDSRIGPKFLEAGPGFGGSCFPKDIKALEYIARQNVCDLSIVKATIESNVQRKIRMAEKVTSMFNGDVSGKNIAVLGLAFKGNTDDCRESPAISIIQVLQEMGANIIAFDPAAMEESKHYVDNISYAEDMYSVCDGADALVILTEWEEFSNLNLNEVKKRLISPIIVDLRNMLKPEEVLAHGFKYQSIGR